MHAKSQKNESSKQDILLIWGANSPVKKSTSHDGEMEWQSHGSALLWGVCGAHFIGKARSERSSLHGPWAKGILRRRILLTRTQEYRQRCSLWFKGICTKKEMINRTTETSIDRTRKMRVGKRELVRFGKKECKGWHAHAKKWWK